MRLTLPAAAVLALGACTGHGIDRTGAVAVRASMEVRPVAEGHAYLEELAEALRPPEPHESPRTPLSDAIEVDVTVLQSARLPPVESRTFHAAVRADLEAAVEEVPPPPSLRAVYGPAHPSGWDLVFVEANGGFVPGAGTTTKVGMVADAPDFVWMFFDAPDGKRFEQLTIDHLGRRIAIAVGDDALLVARVEEMISGGAIQIATGPDLTAPEVIARLTRQR